MIYEHGGAAHSVSLEPLPGGGYRATVGDRVYAVTAEAIDGGWLLSLDGRRIRVYVAARGSERFVSVEGASYALTTVQGQERRRAASAASGDLTAQMPGQVREVFVAAGDAVTSGQTLLLLEAMKMEIRVSAPADGRIRRLLVTAGDVVDRGQRLVEME